jgi:hypothetical protein
MEDVAFRATATPFLLLVQKKWGKEKATPSPRPKGFPALLSKQGVCGTRYAQTVLDEIPLLTSVARRG